MATVKRQKTPAYGKLVSKLKDLDKKNVQVGFFPSAKYPNGIPVAYIAAIQEFGYLPKNIPPRSFMRTTQAEKSGNWADTMKKAMEADMSATNALNLVGLQAAGDVKEKIIAIDSPPLQPSTIKNRKRKMADGKTTGSLDKPLVETGILLKSVTHQVSEDDGGDS